jgi:hypothetical protein
LICICNASNDVLSLVESNERPFVVEEKDVIAQQVRVEVSELNEEDRSTVQRIPRESQ